MQTFAPDFDETLAQTAADLESLADDTLNDDDVQSALNDDRRDDAW